MKNAFSMIELVFVIVVIGILAGVAMPKLFANRDTAEIVKLKEQVEAIRKGIEAYAGSQYIETGVKKYPEGLCLNSSNNAATCKNNMTIKGHFFTAVIQNAVEFGSKKGNWNGWTNSVTHETFIYYADNNQNGYVFQYNKNNGTFNCLNSYGTAKVLPCKNLGE